MCDINCIWLFNLLVAFVLIIQQQQQHVVVVAIKQQQHHKSPYDDLTSYASSLATKYLHQQSLPKVNVVKREIKNDKNTDFISYLSDFNMQDEASIPEDIFDQRHLKEIEEKERRRSVDAGHTTAAVGGVVATEAVNGGDIIDANLPYDDSDADNEAEAEADIILESQRSSERNFSSNDDGNKSNPYEENRNSAGYEVGDGMGLKVVDMAEVRLVDDAGIKTEILKKSNNKKERFKDKKTINSGHDKKRQGYEQWQLRQRQKEIKYENNIESTPLYSMYGSQEQQDFTKDRIENDNYEDGIDDDEEDDDDGSAEYERFKCMHEKKLREQQQQKEREEQQRKQQQQQQHLEQKRRQQQIQQLTSLKKLNERKFNKPSFNEHTDHNNDNENNDNGDASNDDAVADDDDADDDNSQSDTNKYSYNNDEYEERHVEEPPGPREKQPEQQQDAIGDIAVEKNDENQNIFNVNNNNNNQNVESKDFPNMFIPRKMKRHNGAARLDDATNRYTRIKPPPQQPQQPAKSQNSREDENLKTVAAGNDDVDDDDGAGVDNQEEYMSHFPAKETNFQTSYYGIVNGNNSQISSSAGGQQQHTSSGINNGPKANEQPGLSNNKAAASAPATTTTPATTEVHEGNKRQSLFEKEKSLRRNNKRYGHKTHKKKYKDYLRYSSVMMMMKPQSALTTTVAPASPAAAAALPPNTANQSTAVTKLIKMDNSNGEDNLRFHKDKYEKKLKMEKLKGIALPASPIFVLRPRDPNAQTPKPFYEGQINYYLETDDDDEGPGGRGSEARFITKGDRMDTNDWYRKLSPVLRNGVKSTPNNNNQEDRAVAAGSSGGGGGSGSGIAGGYTPYHHYRSHHQRNHHHNNHHQKHHHHHHSRNHAYQRKMIPKKLLITTTPMPPPSRKHPDESAMRELGHQITDLKEFERYYAKWPHLARVQSQLYDEQLREQLELQNLQQQQLGNYQDYEYDEDYFEALQGINSDGGGGNKGADPNNDENLPPYIRKYNRRNKQLLDLLEGTLPPPTRPPQQLRWSGSKLQPGPRDSSSVGSMSVRIDDDYLKEKRKRYHQRQKQIHDLFEQQRGTTTTTTPQPPYPYVNSNGKDNGNSNSNNNNEPEQDNHLPDEDVSISMETEEQDDMAHEQRIWQKEIGSKSSFASASSSATTSSLSSSSSSSKAGNSPIHWQMEKLVTPSPKTPAGSAGTAPVMVAPSPKSAIYKLPSYPSIAGSYIQRPRSRSAQFAPSSGSEFRRVTPGQYAPNSNSNFINAGGFVAYNGHNTAANAKSMSTRFSTNQVNTTALPSVLATPNSSKTTSPSTSSSSSSSPASVSNSFVYHRVIDASPRLVGAGLTGHKQRLPFVAITDRRLETSKKSLTDHQKDFEQNHYPLP